MKKEITLNNEIKMDINSGSLKTRILVEYLLSLNNVVCPSETDTNKISLNMLVIDNCKVVTAEYDRYENILVCECEDVTTPAESNNEVLNTIEPIKVNSAVTCTSEFVSRNDLVALSDAKGNYYIAKRENYIKDFENHMFSFTGNYIVITRNIYQLSSGTWEDETIKEHNLFSELTIEEIHNIYDFVNNLNLDAQVENISIQSEEVEQINEVINSSSKQNNIVEIKENIKTDFNFCYEYLDNKSDIQKGKILKILNTKMTYNNKVITRKDFIHTLLKEYGTNNIKLKIYDNTDRYSNRKVCLTYKKLQDKKEYEIHIAEAGEKFYYQVTKTEYDYMEYLIDNKLKEVI